MNFSVTKKVLLPVPQALKSRATPMCPIASSRTTLTDANVDNDYIMEQINSIESHYTEAFFMHYEGFKYEAIAEHFNIPLGTVKSRIFLARKKMMEKLADQRH